MPQTRSTASATGRPPVPVSIFLVTPHRRRSTAPVGGEPADWCGLQARHVAHLIDKLTQRGDIVVDLDTHPTITRAARYLGCQPAHLVTDGDRHQMRPVPPARRILGRHDGAGLITARLPRAGAYSADLHGMTHAMHTWRRLLRPGGFLLTALTAPSVDNNSVSHRTTVITAARAAGLFYRQEFLVVRRPLPEFEPSTMPDNWIGTLPALVGGRHDVVHVRLVAFGTTPGGTHA